MTESDFRAPGQRLVAVALAVAELESRRQSRGGQPHGQIHLMGGESSPGLFLHAAELLDFAETGHQSAATAAHRGLS